jgi:hypothetical protein
MQMDAEVEHAMLEADQARSDADRIVNEAEAIKKDAQERQMCVICQDRIKNMLLLPCKHLCLCEECSGHAQVSSCPICRKPIKEKMKVFS